jgi:GNAT superfamily N-acetyltransferase
MMIRSATQDDLAAIGDLWQSLVEHHMALDAAMPRPAADGAARYADRLANMLNDPYAQALVAEVDGRVVGYVTALIAEMRAEMFAEERAGLIADIYVHPSFRGAGIGRALLGALNDWFRLRGAAYVEWYVASRNEAARGFWQRVGGRDVMVRMRLDLDQDA